jgi:hypothetical protein
MRYTILLLAMLTFFACKKEETPPVVVTPDYADSVVGTYLGSEVRKGSDNFTVEYSNGSKTMIVEKLDKNKIQLKGFTSGPMPIFSLSDAGSGNIELTPDGFPDVGFNQYVPSSKQLNIAIANGYTNGQPSPATRYYYFQGTKQ